jgi:hypothetical protein
MFSGSLSSSCSTGVTRRITLVTNPVISQELGKDRIVITTVKEVYVAIWDTDIP